MQESGATQLVCTFSPLMNMPVRGSITALIGGDGRSLGTGRLRFRPPVQMIKLTKTQEITTCKWVHPDEERR
ncbi:hypothetical protein CQ10_08305 [Bradyrhizobium valentinum]|nr:hypothetical protein CQ10_08305 [Bradyrhizobium valentinum]